MQILEEKILRLGKVPVEGVVKVDSFLNHVIDPELIIAIGKEFAERFTGVTIDKILTVEASGIAPALGVGLALGVPVLFVKKALPSTMLEGYSATVHSFTKNKEYTIFVSKEYLSPNERILIVDDFLAMGSAVLGMKNIIMQAGALCVGAGIVIEKSFQPGRATLEEQGIRVESLARIISASPEHGIEFISAKK